MPKKPVNIAKYFSFVIFSVFKKIFNQIIVNIGAELIIKVTRPEEINFSAYTNDQLTKKIDVNPGASLSLQMHFHRSEHWIVVNGTAKVEVGNIEKIIGPNESVYIPLGAKHRLSNPTKLPLTLIEIQSGSYLGEDDIKRFEDKYGREYN